MPSERIFIDEIVAPALRNGHGRELWHSLLTDAVKTGDHDKLRALQAAFARTAVHPDDLMLVDRLRARLL
jgi:hypothetical protein